MKNITRKSTICLDYRVELNTSQISEAQAATYFAEQEDLSDLTEDEETEDVDRRVPALSICILIVGTRGDVQPFIAIGKRLLVGFGLPRPCCHVLLGLMFLIVVGKCASFH